MRMPQCSGRNRRCRKDRDANACKNMRPKELWLETIGEIVSETFKSRQRTMWIARRRARDSTGAIYLGTKGDVIRWQCHHAEFCLVPKRNRKRAAGAADA
jgi:hypothetical protein